jgi:hypothetical protein
MKPGPFTNAAMMLVNGNDPKLLAVALADYSRLIGSRRPNKDNDKDDDALLSAARVLEENLPYYAQHHLVLPAPEYIEEILIALPKLIEFLQAQVRPPRKGGQSRDRRRKICAAICAEAWRHYHHGQVQPYSSKLQEACEIYWRACGNPETDDASGSIRNWERPLVDVVAANDEEFRKNFLHYITIPK